jgi:hypothetical protein
MKYIDADRLRAEIERRIYEISHPLKDGYEVQSIGKIEGLSELLEVIDSLQQEQPEMDLEKEIDRFEDWMETYNQADYPTSFTTRDIARYFARWQYQKDRGKFAQIKAKTWSEGFDACKEQMMKDAVEGKIIFLLNGDVAINIGDTDEYKLGEKVCVIVLPKED